MVINLSNKVFISTNSNYDFYISKKKEGRSYYAYMVKKDSSVCDAMAGFSTKKIARECVNIWHNQKY